MSTRDDEQNDPRPDGRREELHEGRRDAEGDSSDRHEAMISAGLDGELGRDERAYLDELLARGDEHSARARSFEQVDEELRSLAAAAIADERLARIFATLRTRLESDRPARAIPNAPEEHSPIAQGRSRQRWGWSSALAVAAALAVYLALPATPPVTEESSPLADSALEPEEELALALGYGDEMSEPGAISNDDLDVIERLDLLDLLSARDMKESG